MRGPDTSRIQHAVETCRSNPREHVSPQPLSEDFVDLPEDDPPLFFIDRHGQQPVHEDEHRCPDTLQEMLRIVRLARENRAVALSNFHVTDHLQLPLLHPRVTSTEYLNASAFSETSDTPSRRRTAIEVSPSDSFP